MQKERNKYTVPKGSMDRPHTPAGKKNIQPQDIHTSSTREDGETLPHITVEGVNVKTEILGDVATGRPSEAPGPGYFRQTGKDTNVVKYERDSQKAAWKGGLQNNNPTGVI